jgi:hypothetical protein
MTDNQSTPRLWEEMPITTPPETDGKYRVRKRDPENPDDRIFGYFDWEFKDGEWKNIPDNVTHWLRPVPGTLIEYWKHRCKLAEKVIEASPCDPDITSQQIKAHDEYKKFLAGSPIPDNDIRTDSVAQLKQVPGIAITEEKMREVIGEAFDECDKWKGYVTGAELEEKRTTYVQNKVDELFKK